MKKTLAAVCAVMIALGGMSQSQTLQAQEYSNPYDPSAPVAGTDAGFDFLALGIGVAVVGAVAAVIIATSDNGSHSH